ncbi:MAG: hypothetical protein V2B19_19900 [Pseudomonadota bacterium]
MSHQWICAKCRTPLANVKVPVYYLGNSFSVEMLKCPGCGTAMVTEEMAVGKMAEAERLLEDK